MRKKYVFLVENLIKGWWKSNVSLHFRTLTVRIWCNRGSSWRWRPNRNNRRCKRRVLGKWLRSKDSGVIAGWSMKHFLKIIKLQLKNLMRFYKSYC